MSDRLSRATSATNAIAANISPVFSPEVEDLAKQRIADGLNATRRVRYRRANDSVGYEDIPDMPIRVACAVKVIEMNVGKAVQRSVIANVNQSADAPSTQDHLLAMLMEHPETASVVLGKLSEAAEKLKIAQAKVVQALPTEAEATS